MSEQLKTLLEELKAKAKRGYSCVLTPEEIELIYSELYE